LAEVNRRLNSESASLGRRRKLIGMLRDSGPARVLRQDAACRLGGALEARAVASCTRKEPARKNRRQAGKGGKMVNSDGGSHGVACVPGPGAKEPGAL